MRGLIDFIASLWRSAQVWRISPIEGVRTGSPLAGCLMFMVMIFALIGIALVTLGFDLNEVDRWLDAQGGWLDLVGRLLFRGFIWLVFLFSVLCCVVVVWAWFADRESVGSIWAALGGFLLFAFFAWLCGASLFAPL